LRLRLPSVWEKVWFGRRSESVLGGVYWVDESKLPADYESAPWFRALTLVAKTSDAGGAPPPRWPVFHRAGTHVGFPRFWGLSTFGPPARDGRVEGDEIRSPVFESHGLAPRPAQALALGRIRRSLEQWGAAFVEAAPGEGKTYIAITMVCEIGRKACVCIPNDALDKQWVGALGRWAPSLRVVVLRGAWNPKSRACRAVAAGEWDVLVSTSQSLSMVEYPAEHVYDRVGTLVVDEAHHIASKTLCQIAPRFPARRVIGLSATPGRRDGLEHALYWLLGPSCFRFQRVPEVTGRSHTVDIRRIQLTGGESRVVCDKSGEMHWTLTTRALSEDEARNRFVAGVVRQLVAAGRARVIALTLFREHVETLGSLLSDLGPATLMGGASDADRASATQGRVVVGTMQFLEEGYDDDVLDTLVLVMPRNSPSSLRQVIGRVERARAGKHRPLVVDFLDAFGPFPAAAYRRSRFYAEQGWRIVKETADLRAWKASNSP
jgi:superfamily II DNA or RNA helicase